MSTFPDYNVFGLECFVHLGCEHYLPDAFLSSIDCEPLETKTVYYYVRRITIARDAVLIDFSEHLTLT